MKKSFFKIITHYHTSVIKKSLSHDASRKQKDNRLLKSETRRKCTLYNYTNKKKTDKNRKHTGMTSLKTSDSRRIDFSTFLP